MVWIPCRRVLRLLQAQVFPLAQINNDTGTKEYQFVTKWGSLGQFDGQNNVAGAGEFVYVPDYHN
jgi:hypothetical protein